MGVRWGVSGGAWGYCKLGLIFFVSSYFFSSSIPFLRLDGTLNQLQREKAIKQFSEESYILVSLENFELGEEKEVTG